MPPPDPWAAMWHSESKSKIDRDADASWTQLQYKSSLSAYFRHIYANLACNCTLHDSNSSCGPLWGILLTISSSQFQFQHLQLFPFICRVAGTWSAWAPLSALGSIACLPAAGVGPWSGWMYPQPPATATPMVRNHTECPEQNGLKKQCRLERLTRDPQTTKQLYSRGPV